MGCGDPAAMDNIKIESVETGDFRMDFFRFGRGKRTLVILPGLSVQSVMGAAEAVAEGEMGSELVVMSSGTSSRVKLCAYSAREVASQIRDSAAIIRRCKPEIGRAHV